LDTTHVSRTISAEGLRKKKQLGDAVEDEDDEEDVGPQGREEGCG
jgi:hypothetical protein